MFSRGGEKPLIVTAPCPGDAAGAFSLKSRNIISEDVDQFGQSLTAAKDSFSRTVWASSSIPANFAQTLEKLSMPRSDGQFPSGSSIARHVRN